MAMGIYGQRQVARMRGLVAAATQTHTFGDDSGDILDFRGIITGSSGTNPDFDYSGSTGTFKTSTGTNTLGGAVIADGGITVPAGQTIAVVESGALTIDGRDVVASYNTNPQAVQGGTWGITSDGSGDGSVAINYTDFTAAPVVTLGVTTTGINTQTLTITAINTTGATISVSGAPTSSFVSGTYIALGDYLMT